MSPVLSSPLVLAVVGAVCVAVAVLLLIRARWKRHTAESDSSEEEAPEPIAVNVVPDHGESDSLLPSLSGMLRSPWHREEPKSRTMRPARKAARTLALGVPLPMALQRKRKAEVVLTKKVHAPYFFPLLDETAQWWQARQQDDKDESNSNDKGVTDVEVDTQSAVDAKAEGRTSQQSTSSRMAPEEEPETEDLSAASCPQDKERPLSPPFTSNGLLGAQKMVPLPVATPIDVGSG